MEFFKEAKLTQAFLKAGIMGFAGSGKTFTASLIANGLKNYAKLKKPISFIDTETGSDFVIPMFGGGILSAKSRAFSDLVPMCKESEKHSDILIIDSLSGFWVELMESYLVKMNRKRLRVQDFGPLKQEWRAFTDWYVNSQMHVIVCGRAGWEYDFREDEDGVTEIQKTGTKFKAESEFGYESSLLIEMEHCLAEEAVGKVGQRHINRAWILKDRFNAINGKSFDFPTFKSFLPHIEKLNIGGAHVGVDTSRTSVGMFSGPESRSNEYKRREIALEEIKQELILQHPGRSDADKQKVIRLLKGLFGTAATSALEQLPAYKLEAGLKTIREAATAKTENEGMEVKEDD